MITNDYSKYIPKKIIHLKNIIAEDFLNYKKPSMFLVTSKCDWKCCVEQHISIDTCQNQKLVIHPTISFWIEEVIKYYLKNEISQAVVIGGLEPFMQFSEILDFIDTFRKFSQDDTVIYTGYNKDELTNEIEKLKLYNNIIIKFGRFIPNQNPHYDEVLGVNLISDNQYAERIN